MWRIDTLWFDLAIVMTIFVVGSILFGHFEEHKPKWRRLLKALIAYIHLRWLPNHGINGWTGEPKAKYYELIGHKK